MASDQASSFDPLGVWYSAVACGASADDDGADSVADGVGKAAGVGGTRLRVGFGPAVVGTAAAITGPRITTAAPSGLAWPVVGAATGTRAWLRVKAAVWCWPGTTVNATTRKAPSATAATAQLTRAAVPRRVLRRRVSRSMRWMLVDHHGRHAQKRRIRIVTRYPVWAAGRVPGCLSGSGHPVRGCGVPLSSR